MPVMDTQSAEVATSGQRAAGVSRAEIEIPGARIDRGTQPGRWSLLSGWVLFFPETGGLAHHLDPCCDWCVRCRCSRKVIVETGIGCIERRSAGPDFEIS